LGLPSRHGEHNAAPDDDPELAMDREAEAYQVQPVHHLLDACPRERSVSDASDGARQAEAADVPLEHRLLLVAGADAGKSADPEPGGRARAGLAAGAWCPCSELTTPGDGPARCKQGAGLSAER
jgi:hypothetical protein